MSDQLPEQTRALRGLMDADRVSAYLGVARGTLRSWESRRAEGKPGGPKDFPAPLDDRLGAGALWDEAEIVAYRRRREASKGGGPSSSPDPATRT